MGFVYLCCFDCANCVAEPFEHETWCAATRKLISDSFGYLDIDRCSRFALKLYTPIASYHCTEPPPF